MLDLSLVKSTREEKVDCFEEEQRKEIRTIEKRYYR